MAPASSSSHPTKKSIRPHRKSRSGCSSCKRRKVKCDEEKPCSNCTRFGLPCDLVPESDRLTYGLAPMAQRGRGRPRKTWTPPAFKDSMFPSPASLPTPPTAVDVDQAELLLHFTTTTASTLGGCECPHQLAFWTRNMPRIGLTRPFVLHLLFAAAAFHLAHLAKHTTADRDDAGVSALLPPLTQRRTRAEYLALAQQHLTAGVSGFSAQLARPGPENCGALYLGAVLTCYCTFADGPSGRDDLLVCTVEGDRDGTGDRHDEGMWDGGGGEEVSPETAVASPSSSPPSSPAVSMPFVYGVRLMHESFSPDVLFAGPMEPLAKAPAPPPPEKPVYVQNGFPRLDWEAQLDGLRAFVAARASPSGGEEGHEGAPPTPASQRVEGQGTRTAAAISLKALDNVIGIYAVIYGRRGRNGEIMLDGPSDNQFVFGWLYRLEQEFASCVRRREPCALLALAHYALLLNADAIPRGWYVEGWKEHIIFRVSELLGDGEASEWMRWPMEQLAVKGGGRGRDAEK